MSAISRSDLEGMDRDQLVEVVLELDRRLEDMEQEVEAVKNRFDRRTATSWERISEVETDIESLSDEFKADLQTQSDQLHRERGKLARRVAALEDELGITATDALATAEAGEEGQHLTKLARLIRHGPEAVSDQPGATLYRARELVENWNDWGTVKDDSLGKVRRLSAKKHRLKTHLESARNEDLGWKQVYRAMEWIDRESGPNVSLEEGNDDEGKYVLVHRLEGDE